MKKYKIIFGGRGAELYIHQINEEQRQKLKEMDVENESVQVDWDKLNQTLGVENVDYTDEIYIGAYPQPSAYHITVFDDKDNLVWESDEDFYMDEGEEDIDYKVVDKENILLIEHYVKGTFFEYLLETENFDPEKLQTRSVEVNETVQVITGLKYDNQEMEVDEYGDNWSKNTVFYLF